MSRSREMRTERIERTELDRIIIEKEERELLIDDRRKEKVKDAYDEDECECDCRKIWKGYKSCLDFTYIGIRNCFISVRNGIYCCIGGCCFPIKERFCNCCDNIDKELNPYKDPHYNPYDYL